jgi:hypothetical protein
LIIIDAENDRSQYQEDGAENQGALQKTAAD